MPGTVADILIESEIIAVGAPGLLAERGHDPLRLPWLTRDAFELGLLRKVGFDPEALQFRNVGPMSMEAAAARLGYGIMICPEIMVQADLASGELERLRIPGLGMMAYHAVTPQGRVRASAAAYIAWLKRELKGGSLSAGLT